MTRIHLSRLAVFLLPALLAASAAADPDFDTAIQTQQARVDSDPSAATWNDLGALELLAGDRNRAQVSFEQALEIDPEDPQALYNLGVILLDDSPARARKLLRSALDQVEDGWTHYRLAQAYEGMQRSRRAVEHYARAFDLDRTLLYPEVNPEIITNDLAVVALLNSGTAVDRKRIEPRFVETGVMRELLLGGSEEVEVPVAEEAGDGEEE